MDRRGRSWSGDGAHYSLAVECEDVRAVTEHLAQRQGGPIDVFGPSYGAVCVLGAAAQGAPTRCLTLYEPPGRGAVSAEWLNRMRLLIRQGELGRAMFSFLVEVIGLSPEEVKALRITRLSTT